MAKSQKQSTQSPTLTAPKPEWIDQVRVHLTDKDSLKAMVSVRLFEAIYLTGLRVIKTEKGVFVAMPSRKTQSGAHQDIYFPASKEWRDALSAAVLEAYHKELPTPAA